MSASGAPSLNIPAKSVTYDVLGNITNKSDVGNYSYGTNNNGTLWRPHAVNAVTGGASQGAATYDYDPNGSLIQRTYANGKHQSLEYASFNMVRKVTQYYSGSLIDSTLEFIFNAEHQRVRQIRTKDGVTSTTEYVHPDNQGGLLFEKIGRAHV